MALYATGVKVLSRTKPWSMGKRGMEVSIDEDGLRLRPYDLAYRIIPACHYFQRFNRRPQGAATPSGPRRRRVEAAPPGAGGSGWMRTASASRRCSPTSPSPAFATSSKNCGSKVVRTVLCAVLRAHPTPRIPQNAVPVRMLWVGIQSRASPTPHRGFASRLRRCGPRLERPSHPKNA